METKFIFLVNTCTFFFSFNALIYMIFTLGALNWRFPVDLFPGGVGLYIFSEISGKIVLKQ